MSPTIKLISVIDGTNYNEKYCRNGGCYGYRTDYVYKNERWYAHQYTTGEFCPYCGKWDCSGDCVEESDLETEQPKFTAEELKKLSEDITVAWEIALTEEVEQPLICPVCQGKTKYFVWAHTVAHSLPLYCQRCKLTFSTTVEKGIQGSRYDGTIKTE